MDNQTIVLPSARAIRHEQLHIEASTLFLPNYITMSEFITKLCIVKDFKYIDDDSRILLLLEASNFKEFSSLQIERNFFTFTKNSSYIFKFFEELSAELYDIDNLINADVYAEYEEHILILQELYKRYEKLCIEKKFLDRIFLPKIYSFNCNYLKVNNKITLHIEGHLTNFEFMLLNQAIEYSDIYLIFNTTNFNTKMQKRFFDLGIVLEIGYKYTILLNEKKIINKIENIKTKKISCICFSESLLQVAFIKHKIYEFINKGYSPQNIAVVLPNEQIATLVKSFDIKGNLNFAMGDSYAHSLIYRKINATVKLIEQDSKENLARIERVGDDLFTKILNIYYKKSEEVDFTQFLNELAQEFTDKQELKIFNEEIYSFSKLINFMKDMSIKSLLSLFMQRLSTKTLDDVRGGKITVMGVLETRAVNFDAVIIIDFDDKNVPKRSDKDMFLNSKIREIADLPTMTDRENLQKHYYEMLINRSSEVAISFVNSSENSGSKFLKQLGIKYENILNELDYANILFTRVKTQPLIDKDTSLEYSFKNIKLSATRLKTYLTCKRKYYFKYIKEIRNHTIPKDMPEEYEIGTAVHSALKELYLKKSSYTDAKELKNDLYRELDKVCGKSELESYLIAIQKKKMESFCQNEIARFKEGWIVHSCEESYSIDFNGMTLIGQIDRIDKRSNEIEVLDYKTGSYTLYTKNSFTDATDFQLEFYYLLSSGLGNVSNCSFYDLKESKIVSEAFLREKLEILQSHIKDLLTIEKIDTKMCEDEKNCLYCEYKIMCHRD